MGIELGTRVASEFAGWEMGSAGRRRAHVIKHDALRRRDHPFTKALGPKHRVWWHHGHSPISVDEKR